MPDTAPRPLRILAAVIATLSVIAGILAASPLLPVEVRGWIALGIACAVVVQTRLPQIWGMPDAPAVEPAKIGDAVVKVAVVLLALSLSGCEVREGYEAMLAVAVAAPVVVLMAGVLVGLGRRGPLVFAALLLATPARAEEPRPAVAPAPVVQLAAPVVQPAPVLPPVVAPLPTIPPAALSPCEVCAGQVGAAIGKPPQTWPTWAKVLVGLGAGAVAALQIARDAGAFPAVSR